MRMAGTIVVVLSLFVTGCSNGGVPGLAQPVSPVAGSASRAKADVGPHASSVVLVVMADRDYDRVIGNAQAPFVNGMLVPVAALMTDSHAVGHPSQPNYLALFSGSTQGIVDDSCPHSFRAPNLGAEMLAAGEKFDGYSEAMPQDGYTGCISLPYNRKHNPWVDFTNVPASSNLIWYDLPGVKPTVSIIVPDVCNDMRHCSTKIGDNWLKANLTPILQFDSANNGLLILTWDEAEPDTGGKNHVATLLLGPMIAPGKYAQSIDHYAVLHTIETIVGVSCTAYACAAPVLRGMWL